MKSREKIIDMLIDNLELRRILSAKRSRSKETEEEFNSSDNSPHLKSSSAVTRHRIPMRVNQI